MKQGSLTQKIRFKSIWARCTKYSNTVDNVVLKAGGYYSPYFWSDHMAKFFR